MDNPGAIIVLVTGFGPFPGVQSNPSGALIELIRRGQYRTPSGINLETAIIPTSWDAVQDFVDRELTDINPDIALHFGVSSRAKGFQIEQLARNTASTMADYDGKTFTGSCLVHSAPPTLRSSYDAPALVQQLQQRGLPAQTSRNAGRYLCNMLLFMSLLRARTSGNPGQCGFIHIPPLTRGIIGMSELVLGLDVIIRHCVQRHRRLKPRVAALTG